MKHNPVAKHLRVNRAQVFRAKKGKGSYSRKGRKR